jgi:hypothetical protein
MLLLLIASSNVIQSHLGPPRGESSASPASQRSDLDRINPNFKLFQIINQF